MKYVPFPLVLALAAAGAWLFAPGAGATTPEGLSIYFTSEHGAGQLLEVQRVDGETAGTLRYRIVMGQKDSAPVASTFISKDLYETIIADSRAELDGLRKAVKKPKECSDTLVRFRRGTDEFEGGLCAEAGGMAKQALAGRLVSRFTRFLKIPSRQGAGQ